MRNLGACRSMFTNQSSSWHIRYDICHLYTQEQTGEVCWRREYPGPSPPSPFRICPGPDARTSLDVQLILNPRAAYETRLCFAPPKKKQE